MRAAAKKRVTIEDLLIWAYRDEKVDRVEGSYVAETPGWHGSSGCGVSAVERIVMQGCRVDCDGAAGIGRHAPHDAVQLHLLVGRLAFETRVLVQTHAQLGTRPEWRRKPPRARPVMRLRGGVTKPTVIYDSGNRPSWCPLAWEGDDEQQAAVRREMYRLWAFGLMCLSNRLAFEPALLERHVVSGHVPDLAPWRREQSRACTASERVVRGESAEGLTCRKSVDIVAAR